MSKPESATHNLPLLINRVIEKFGSYQKFVWAALCLNSLIVGINGTVTAFYVYTPESYYCGNVTSQVHIVIPPTSNELYLRLIFRQTNQHACLDVVNIFSMSHMQVL